MNTDKQTMKQIISQDADVLRSLESATKDLGFDLEEEVIKLGLPPSLLNDPDLFVPSQLFNCLLERIAKSLNCYDLGIQMAKHLSAPHLGLPTRVMSLCQNVKQALDKATHYSAFYRDTGPWQYQISDKTVKVFKVQDFQDQQKYLQRSLFGTAQMYSLITKLCDSQWKPASVSFSHKNPGGKFAQTYNDFFDCPVLFDQAFEGISFDAEHLNDAVVSADNELLFNIEQHIESLNKEILCGGDILSNARQIINQRLNFANCTLEEVAQFLSLSPNDFSKRLEQRAISFITLLEEQVCEKANFYLTQLNAPTELILSTLMPGNEPRLNELLMDKIAASSQW